MTVIRSSPSHFAFEPVEARILLADTWGASAQLVHQDLAASYYSSFTGQGITVAVIDSGINYNVPSLGAGFGPGYKVIGGYDFVDNDSNPVDTDGHGTEVAGVIAADPFDYNGKHYSGVAPDAKLVALRVTHGADGAADSNIEKALQWVISNYEDFGIKVVNISLGSGNHSTAQTNATLSDEFATLASLNIAVFAASGNSGESPVGSTGIAYPAADANVISVGSVNSSDTISTFTQRGSLLDLLAPGEDIVTTSRQGGFTTVDGTSFASPFAAGVAALVTQANPGISVPAMLSILRASGTTNKDGDTETGRITGQYFPRIDVYNSLKLTNVRKATKSNVVGNGSAASDIVYDDQGILHLAYYDPSIQSIRYATRDLRGFWSKTQIIDTSGADVGIQVSIAIDSTGKPGIAYFDNTNSDLKYAHFNGNAWDVETRDRNKSVGQSPSLTYNINGDPVIGYYRKSGGDLKVQTWDSNGNWIKYDVDSDADVGEWASVSAAQDANVFAVAYNDKTNGDLKYARWADGQWTIFTVDDLQIGAAYIDLNIHNNQAFISYQDLQNGDLRFAKRENSQWHTETVYTPGNTGQFTSLIFDSSNNAHIVFYSKSKNLLYEAVGNFGSWTVKKVGNGGTWLSAAATSDENTLTFVALDTTRKNLQFGSLTSL